MPNIADHLFARAQSDGAKVALVLGDMRLTFADVHARTCRAAAGLAEAGFAAGDKLAIMLPTGAEFIVFEYASYLLGGVVVPLNVHYKGSEIEGVLVSCEVDFLVIDAEFISRLSGDVWHRLPRLRRVFALGGQRDTAAKDVSPSAEALLNSCSTTPPRAERAADDVALMLHTSATTGRAKGVMLTLGNLQFNYDQTPRWLGLARDDRILCALPLYNTFGLNQCINATMVTGATLVLLPRFDVLECLNAIQAERCSFFPCVPTMLQKLLNDPRTRDVDITSVRRILVGAAPVPGPLLEQVYRTMGRDTVVMTGYGLTEASALVSIEHTSLDESGILSRPKSVGKPLPGMQMIIADESGREAPPGTVGQICIRGPNVMKGYYRLETETGESVVDGWLRTGDLGTMDSDGHFYVVDRQKDLIIRGGQNIYPADVEDTLYSHPAVAEAAVVGQADEILGEVPVAYVALKPGRSVTVTELIELCTSKLAYFKVPRSIHLLDELPKGPTGKILRRGLRAVG